ncbi:MAG: PLP-dependent aminotransferase family protein [Gammaproteobacteria bacterium]
MTVEANTGEGAPGFLYDQVSRHITGLIDSGTLRPGDRVPSLRKLSGQLKVSLSTVTQAYMNLERQGVLKARPQSGYYVNAPVQPLPTPPRKTSPAKGPRKVRISKLFEDIFSIARDPDVLPLGAAVPSMDLMPVKGLLRATTRAANANARAAVSYAFTPGDPELRRQIARLYMDQGLTVPSDEIITTSGASEAVSLALQSVVRRGDIIAVESPTYFAVLRLIERMGLMAVEIDTDPDTGICLDALETALETMDIKTVLTIPNFNNPVGSMMPEENKKRLVELVSAHDTPVIEDDIYGDLYFGDQRPGTLRRYDTDGLVITCSSFSKTLAPGYRIGWIIPGERFRDDVLEWKQATTSAVASIPQMAVAEFLRSGDYDRHLVRMRRTVREQVETMRYLIGRHFPEGTRVTNPQGGYVLWVEMPRGSDCLEVFEQALKEGIAITPGILFSATRRYRNFIRINCGFPITEGVEDGIRRLGTLIAS